MARRSSKAQSQHDAEVKQTAKDLQDKGYKVAADVKGFPRPKTIGGVRPDVVAEKGNERKIIEVETPESADSARDQRQQRAFRAAANRSKKTTFTRKVTGK
jgi:hypothetical protein